MDSAVFSNQRQPRTQSASSLGWYDRFSEALLGAASSVNTRSAAESVVGSRASNEDRCYRSDLHRFYMVADGIGGQCGGALASQIAVETIPAAMVRWIQRGVEDQAVLQQAFRDAVDKACAEMARVAARYRRYADMGCTVAVAFFIGNRLYYSNLGDCRVYTYDGRRTFRLTHDHTWVQNLIDAGVLSEPAAKSHRWRHLITNSVSAGGVNDPPWLEQVSLAPGEKVLLTTDGLTDVLDDDALGAVLAVEAPLSELADRLISVALARGAVDNTSCIVVDPTER